MKKLIPCRIEKSRYNPQITGCINLHNTHPSKNDDLILDPKKDARRYRDFLARKQLDFPRLLWRCFIEAWELSVQLRVPTLLAGGTKSHYKMGNLESQWLSWIYPFPDFLVANKGLVVGIPYTILGIMSSWSCRWHPGWVGGKSNDYYRNAVVFTPNI